MGIGCFDTCLEYFVLVFQSVKVINCFYQARLKSFHLPFETNIFSNCFIIFILRWGESGRWFFHRKED